MYDAYFNFATEPFRLSPDHSLAYAHKGYSKARAYMAYAYMRAEGFVMITGRPGTGKTTLVGALIEQLAGERVTTANLVCTQLEADDLLKLVAYDFGIDNAITQKGDLLQQLTRRLKAWHRDGRRALLIVDEAQDLSVSAMEELRLLTNIQEAGKPLLQIFLLGQPELRELILSPQLEQVHQRIVAASHLEALEQQETEAYVRHRLEAVGWKGDPAISKAVYPLIYKFSEGVPRRINLICSRLFLHCAVEQRHKIAVDDLREVVGELQGENLAAGTTLSARDFRVQDEYEPHDPGDGGPQGRSAAEPSSPGGRPEESQAEDAADDGCEDPRDGPSDVRAMVAADGSTRAVILESGYSQAAAQSRHGGRMNSGRVVPLRIPDAGVRAAGPRDAPRAMPAGGETAANGSFVPGSPGADAARRADEKSVDVDRASVDGDGSGAHARRSREAAAAAAAEVASRGRSRMAILGLLVAVAVLALMLYTHE